MYLYGHIHTAHLQDSNLLICKNDSKNKNKQTNKTPQMTVKKQQTNEQNQTKPLGSKVWTHKIKIIPPLAPSTCSDF